MGYGKGNIGRPRGTSKYPYRDDQDREAIVKYIKQGKTNRDIAALSGWSEVEVRDLRAIFFPTVGLAEDYLKASALKMAIRVVEEANVEEAMDVLSRPNIGVLQPIPKSTGPQIGFFTNVQTSTLGSVQPHKALAPAPVVIDLEPVPDAAPEPDSVHVPVPVHKPRPVLVRKPVPVPKKRTTLLPVAKPLPKKRGR